jgi:hypothetical protein
VPGCGGCGVPLPGIISEGLEAAFCPICAAKLTPDQRVFFDSVEREWRRWRTFDRLEPGAMVGGAALVGAAMAWGVPNALPFAPLPVAVFSVLAAVEMLRRRTARRLLKTVSRSRQLAMLGPERPGYPALCGLSKAVGVAMWLPIIFGCNLHPGRRHGRGGRPLHSTTERERADCRLARRSRLARRRHAIRCGLPYPCRERGSPTPRASSVRSRRATRLRECCAEFSIRKQGGRIEWTAVGIVDPEVAGCALEALCALATPGTSDEQGVETG